MKIYYRTLHVDHAIGSGNRKGEYGYSIQKFSGNISYSDTENAWDDRSYPTVGFKLTLTRHYLEHIFSFYIPSWLFVALSWVSFAIPPEVVPGRMALLITLMLVLVNISGTVIDKNSPTEYLTFLDIWMFACIVYVWMALIAYAFLLLHKRFMVWKNKPKCATSLVETESDTGNQKRNTKLTTSYDHYGHWDGSFLICFPLAFLLFNIVYWSIVATS